MWLKNIEENKNSYLYWGYLTVIGIIFYIMNVLTPLSADDYKYAFIIGEDEPIKNLADIFKSQYNHYFTMNGRFIPHFFVQLFTGILGKHIFNVVNTIIFICFIHLLLINTIQSKELYYKFSSIICFLLFFLFPVFCEVFLWISGCLNYLWVSVLLLLFHHLLMRCKEDTQHYILLIVFGIICGWTHEGIVIAMLGGYFFYFLFNKNELYKSRFYLLTGLCIGIAFVVLSPGIRERASSNNTSLIQLFNVIFSTTNLRLIFLVGITFIILKIKHICNIQIVLQYLIWVLSISFSLILVIFIARTTYPRSFYGVEFFSLILLILLWQKNKISNTYIHVGNILLISYSAFVITNQYQNYHDWKNVEQQLIGNKSSIVYTNESKYSFLTERLILRYLVPEHCEFYNSFIKENNRENRRFTIYYGRENIQFLPIKFYNEVNNNPNQFTHFTNIPDFPFYIKEIKSPTINQVTLKIRVAKDYEIPFYHKPFASKLTRYNIKELDVNNYTTTQINNRYYLLIGKNQLLNNRIIDVSIK